MRWRPLSIRNNPEKVAAHDVLHDGVPPWLASAAGRWVVETIGWEPRDDQVSPLQAIEQLLRFPLDWGDGARTAVGSLANEVARDGERALDIIDACLFVSRNWPNVHYRWAALEESFSQAGSAWTLGLEEHEWPCLQRRVDETVESAAKEVMRHPGNASYHLRAAWHGVYGRNPNASAAYREAVRAVEAAAKPVLTPNDPVATLGKMIRAVRDKPSKWISRLGSIEAVADMMDQLWTSQLDRHGTDDESLPLSVSPEQAEAATHLAATLVHWFRQGHIRLVP